MAEIVDKDRVAGSAKQIKGAVKQVVGKAVGDAKLESEGKADKIEGKVQNVVGGLKDTLKGKEAVAAALAIVDLLRQAPYEPDRSSYPFIRVLMSTVNGSTVY